jgi:hypothetical protein
LVTLCRCHVLDNGAKTAQELMLVLLREGLCSPVRQARAVAEEPISPSWQDKPGRDGGGDDAAVRNEPAAQPGGGLRAAAGRAGRAHRCVPASPATAIAPSLPFPKRLQERGGE